MSYAKLPMLSTKKLFFFVAFRFLFCADIGQKKVATFFPVRTKVLDVTSYWDRRNTKSIGQETLLGDMNQQHSTFPRRDSRNEEEKDIASLVLDNQHHQYSLGEDVHISEVLTESNGTHENGATTVLPSIMSEEFGKDILQREVAPQMFPGMVSFFVNESIKKF